MAQEFSNINEFELNNPRGLILIDKRKQLYIRKLIINYSLGNIRVITGYTEFKSKNALG